MKPLLLGLGWFPDEPGGSNRYFRELLEQLQEHGHSPSGVVIGPANATGGHVVVAASADDRLALRLRRFKAAAERLGRSTDLVDVHFALYALLPVVLGRLRGKPLVVHFHGPWADESAAAGRGGSRLSLLVKRTVEKAVYRRAEAAITLSGAFKRILVERYAVQPWRVEVVPPGVDLERFSPGDRQAARAELLLDDATWVACSVRRLVPRTGLDVLLRAWAHLDRERLLLVAGVGPERQRLEELAADLGITGSVRFLGGVSEESLVAVYRAADVSVVPSTALEGFGLVVLESLACGTPVVAMEVGGLPSALAGLEPRSLVVAGDVFALAERLSHPLPGRGACREHAEQFSWGACIDRHVQLYQRAVRPPRDWKLRVVYIDHTARLSGAELALLRLLPALEDVEAHVILGEDGPLVARLHEAGVSVEVMTLAVGAASLDRERIRMATATSREGVEAAIYTVRLARRLHQLRPDLVHTNSLKAAIYGGLAARMVGIPVVSHAHDRLANDYLPVGAARVARAAFTLLPRAVIAPSHAVAETLGRAAYIIPWAAETSTSTPAQAHPFRVGIVGRIAPWKGQHVFIEAFARAFPDGDEQAVVVGAPLFGAAEQHYMDGLRELARSLGLDERLHFTGFVEDIDAELASLDALVHASVVPEPFGQVVVEGMAAGLPVVAAGEGGPAELISDGVDGLLYPTGDAEALAAHLKALAADPELCQRIGAAARRRAASFTPAALAERVSGVYAHVLAGGLPAEVPTSKPAENGL